MRRETKGGKTKKLLYDCALSLFREKGYRNVTVNEIVEAAGTAKGTFYIYFHSKSSIIGELLRQYDDYYQNIYASLDHATPVDEQLDVIIGRSCEFTQSVIGLDLIRVLYENQLQMPPDEQEALDVDRPLYRMIAALIRMGQQRGEYSADEDPARLTGLMVRCLRGTFYDWCLEAGGFDLRAEGLAVTRAFRRSFQN